MQTPDHNIEYYYNLTMNLADQSEDNQHNHPWEDRKVGLKPLQCTSNKNIVWEHTHLFGVSFVQWALVSFASSY